MVALKRILSIGIACGTLTMSHAAYAETQGAQLPHFYPAKAWEVGSIKAVSDYSGECIIQNEFNNGFLLQINGSSNWVQQLNLNIRQNAFTVGNDYDVSLNVPGREAEIIKSSANRQNIISVPLKGKKELYKAMRDNGVLDVTIEGNEFRFFLTGFSGAANKFERCMAGGAPGAVAAKNVRDDEKAGLGGVSNGSEDIAVSSDNLSDDEKGFLVNESIAFEEQEAAMKEIKALDDALVKEEDAVAALNASAVEALEETQDAENLPALEPQASESLEPIAVERKAAPAIVVKMDEPVVEKTQNDVQTATVIDDVVAVPPQAFEEPAAGDTNIDAAVTPIMPESDMKVAESLLAQPERSIDMPRIKVNKQKSHGKADFSVADIETADTKALAKIAALEKELAKARAQNQELNDELRVSLKESKQEVMSVETDNWNLERATMRFHEAERQMKKLGQQLQKERAQWAMEKKELETMLFDPEVTSQEQLARLSKLEQELAKTKAELDAARAALKVGQ